MVCTLYLWEQEQHILLKYANIILPFIIVTGILLRLPAACGPVSMEVSAKLMVYVMFGILLVLKNVWIGSFFILAIFSTYYPHYDADSHNAFQCLLVGMLFYYSLTIFNFKRNTLLNIIIAVAVINFLVMWAQWKGFAIFANSRGAGIFGNPNLSSCVMALSVAAFCRNRWKWLLPVPLIGLVMAKSFIGPMAVCLAATILIFRLVGCKNSFLYLVGVLCALSLYIIFVDQPNYQGRIMVWAEGLKHISTWGIGIGHWKQVEPGRWYFAHSDYIETIIEMGLVSGMLIFGYLMSTIKRTCKDNAQFIFGILIMGILSTGAFPMQILPIAMIAGIYEVGI